MDIDYSKVPPHYLHCTNVSCPQAEHCLRFAAAQSIPASVVQYIVLNPAAAMRADGSCMQYQDAEPCRMARGMNQMLRQVRTGDIRLLRTQLCAIFGRSAFYRLKKGDQLITPAQQAEIADVMSRMAPYVAVQFDDYEEAFLFI